MRLCFGPLIQRELEVFREQWNHHRICKSSMAEYPSEVMAECLGEVMAEGPGGVPELLFNIPQYYGITPGGPKNYGNYMHNLIVRTLDLVHSDNNSSM